MAVATAVFNVKPYPETSHLQGSRIAPVWRDFIRATEARDACDRLRTPEGRLL